MFETLLAEWTQWTTSIRAARTLTRWAAEDPGLRGWTVDDLAAPRASSVTDTMQAALVSRAQAGERAAVLTLMIQLRPGLGALARWAERVDHRFGSPAEAAEEVVAVFGEVLMGHNLQRRPGKVAANLLRDSRQRIWRASCRDARAAEAALNAAPIEACRAQSNRSDDWAMELDLAGIVGSALDDVSGSAASRRLNAELAYRAWILDEPGAAIAADLGVDHGAVRTRLSRLRRAMKQRQPAAV